MTSVKYDGTELANATYVTGQVGHESAPSREVSSGRREDGDGEVFVSTRYGAKRIQLTGYLASDSAANLETAIDAFKELMGRVEKTLAITYAGGTRNYVATCESHAIDRGHFDIMAAPWTATFVVLSGEGKDTSATLALNEHSVTVTTPGTDSFTLAGSKPPQPTITIKRSTAGATTRRGVEYMNTDTGERLIYTKNAAWQANCSVVINCLERKVTSDVAVASQVEGDFYGVFPSFIVGTNNVKITLGGIVNQKSTDVTAGESGNSSTDNSDNSDYAQSFRVPYPDATFQGVTLCLSKTGAPNNITVIVRADSGGKPKGSIVSTFTIDKALVGASPAYITGYADAPFTLAANTTYWIEFYSSSLDGSNYYDFWAAPTNGYPGGKSLYSSDAGSTWGAASYDAFSFRLLFGGVGNDSAQTVKHSVSYKKTYL
jgi:hypothetical protein